jgi:hypothetical protein
VQFKGGANLVRLGTKNMRKGADLPILHGVVFVILGNIFAKTKLAGLNT